MPAFRTFDVPRPELPMDAQIERTGDGGQPQAKAGHLWRTQCPTSTMRQGPAAPQALAETDYEVDYQWGRSELSAARSSQAILV